MFIKHQGSPSRPPHYCILPLPDRGWQEKAQEEDAQGQPQEQVVEGGHGWRWGRFYRRRLPEQEYWQERKRFFKIENIRGSVLIWSIRRSALNLWL